MSQNAPHRQTPPSTAGEAAPPPVPPVAETEPESGRSQSTAAGPDEGSLYEHETPRSDRTRPRVRRPFGSATQRLYHPTIPGFRTYWFNDEPGRIRQAEDAGYEHVEEDGKPIMQVVGVNRAGGPLIGYLMKIPMEWFLEDNAAAQARVDLVDRAIRRGGIRSDTAEVQSAMARDDTQDVFYASSKGRTSRLEEGTGRPGR